MWDVPHNKSSQINIKRDNSGRGQTPTIPQLEGPKWTNLQLKRGHNLEVDTYFVTLREVEDHSMTH